MSDVIEAKRPKSAKKGRAAPVPVTLALPDWAFDESAADSALAHAMKAGESFAKSEHDLERANTVFQRFRREILLASYDFVTCICPPAQLEELKQRVGDLDTAAERKESFLPESVILYLKSKNLPVPHWRSHSPFQGILQAVYQRGRVARKLVSAEEAENTIQLANDPDSAEKMRKERQAEYTRLSRMSSTLLAAIDMADRKIIENDEPEAKVKAMHGEAIQRKGTLGKLPDDEAPRRKKAERREETAAPEPSIDDDGVSGVIFDTGLQHHVANMKSVEAAPLSTGSALVAVSDAVSDVADDDGWDVELNLKDQGRAWFDTLPKSGNLSMKFKKVRNRLILTLD